METLSHTHTAHSPSWAMPQWCRSGCPGWRLRHTHTAHSAGPGTGSSADFRIKTIYIEWLHNFIWRLGIQSINNTHMSPGIKTLAIQSESWKKHTRNYFHICYDITSVPYDLITLFLVSSCTKLSIWLCVMRSTILRLSLISSITMWAAYRPSSPCCWGNQVTLLSSSYEKGASGEKVQNNLQFLKTL